MQAAAVLVRVADGAAVGAEDVASAQPGWARTHSMTDIVPNRIRTRGPVS